MASVCRIRLVDVAGRTVGPPKSVELTGRPNGSAAGSILGVGALNPSKGPFAPTIIASESRPGGLSPKSHPSGRDFRATRTTSSSRRSPGTP